MNTVFVIQDSPGKNLLPAREFGQLRVMLSGRESVSLAVSKIRSGLSEMRNGDYLLLIGSPLFIGIASHVALSNLHSVNFLVWDRETYTYKKEKVNYDQSANTTANR